jgi:hypothetical protein
MPIQNSNLMLFWMLHTIFGETTLSKNSLNAITLIASLLKIANPNNATF